MKPYYQDAAVTLYHGDCREVLPSLPSCFRVDAMVTDPPYGIGYGKYESHRDAAAEYADVLRGVWLAESIVSNGWAVVFQAAIRCREWVTDFPREWRLFSLPKTFIQILPGVGPNYATDFALYWQIGEPKWPAKGHRPFDYFVCATSDMSLRPKGHPCPRPLNGMAYLVAGFVLEGGTVIDPFAGSGTTLRAAKDLGRRAIGIEIEERYCEIAAKRLAQEVLPLGRSLP